MAAKIGTRRRPDRIELESPDFMGFAHGSHHEKDGLGLLDEDEFLLDLCICDHCDKRAAAAKVPIEEARRNVAGLLEAGFAGEFPQAAFPDFPAKGPDSLAGFPALRVFVDWRPEPVTSLIAEIRAAKPPGTRPLLIDAKGARAGDIDLPPIMPHVDGILHCACFNDTARIAPLMAATPTLLGAVRPLIAGFQLFHPNLRDRADLAARVGQAKGHADGFNFYNLGLVPPARLAWIRQSPGPVALALPFPCLSAGYDLPDFGHDTVDDGVQSGLGSIGVACDDGVRQVAVRREGGEAEAGDRERAFGRAFKGVIHALQDLAEHRVAGGVADGTVKGTICGAVGLPCGHDLEQFVAQPRNLGALAQGGIAVAWGGCDMRSRR